MVGTQLLEPSWLPSRVCVSRKLLSGAELGLEVRNSVWDGVSQAMSVATTPGVPTATFLFPITLLNVIYVFDQAFEKVM